MAQYDIYIDVVRGVTVAGLNNTLGVSLPQWFQGDSPTLRIWLLNPTFNPIGPYVYIPVAGISLEVAIGDKIGNVSNLYTQQFVWTPSADLTQPYFIAQLPLNTAAITALIGAQASATSTFAVTYLQAGLPTTVIEVPITIQAAVIKNGALVQPPGQTFLSAEVANATYLTKTITGGFFLVNPNTGKKYEVYVDDNGSLEAGLVS